MSAEAVGNHQTRGAWEAHRTFLGRWVVHWLRGDDIEVRINLPEGAYIQGCDTGRCS